MTDAEMGLLGGIAGAALGVAGGVFGAWMSLRSARPGAERRHVARWVVYFSALAVGFCVAMLLLPEPWRWFLWIPYAPALTMSIRACNREQLRIQQSASDA